MRDSLRVGRERLGLDGDWSLQDLSDFCRTYLQLYSVLYSIFPPVLSSLNDEELERLRYTYGAFPWRGGYSAVDFYESLRRFIPKDDRPIVRRVRYESPGFIELGLVVGVALSIKTIVKAVTTSIRDINGAYNDIYKGMQQRKLTDIDVKRRQMELTHDQLRFAREAQEQFGELISLDNVAELERLASNEVVSPKVMLSVYRRARALSKDEREGKLDLDKPGA